MNNPSATFPASRLVATEFGLGFIEAFTGELHRRNGQTLFLPRPRIFAEASASQVRRFFTTRTNPTATFLADSYAERGAYSGD